MDVDGINGTSLDSRLSQGVDCICLSISFYAHVTYD
jgi:hypothetical protein